MIIKETWNGPADVIAKMKSLVNTTPESVLVLGAGRLGLEGEVFALKNIPFTAVEWCDSDLAWIREKYPSVVAVKADVSDCDLFMEYNSPMVTAFDIAEHLPKEKAAALLQRLALGYFGWTVLLWMPIQSTLCHAIEDLTVIQEDRRQKNEVLNCHLSLWTPEEIEDMGFKVWYDPSYHIRRTGDMNFEAEGAMIGFKEIK